ncbi:MAG TPA: hypothetical protein VMM36_02280 [Opitutaceae bacterium]|nr:hypothetical protein [Opitutaceae bacterium]
MKSPCLIVAVCIFLAGCAAVPRLSDAPVVSGLTEEQESSLYALHYQIIPGWLFNSNGLFFVSLINEDIDRLRDAIAEIAGAEYAAGVGLKVSENRRIVYITFPKPARTPLCHHVALVRIPGSFRYLTLEQTDNPFSLWRVSFFCEWTSQSARLNYGPRNYTSLQKFEKEVVEFQGTPSLRSPGAATEFN